MTIMLLHNSRVVHSSHFQAIFSSFLVFIFLPFFKNELQNESKNELKNDHFCLHFAFILSFHFCCYFKLSSDAYVQLL